MLVSEHKGDGRDSFCHFIYGDPSTGFQVFVCMFHEVPQCAIQCLNLDLVADVCNASNNDRAASLVLVPEKNLVPIDGRCHFASSMVSFMGSSAEMRIVTERAWDAVEGKTCIIVEYATRVPLDWC